MGFARVLAPELARVWSDFCRTFGTETVREVARVWSDFCSTLRATFAGKADPNSATFPRGFAPVLQPPFAPNFGTDAARKVARFWSDFRDACRASSHTASWGSCSKLGSFSACLRAHPRRRKQPQTDVRNDARTDVKINTKYDVIPDVVSDVGNDPALASETTST